MADIGKPLKRYVVVPLTEPIPETREPQEAPLPEKTPEREKEPA